MCVLCKQKCQINRKSLPDRIKTTITITFYFFFLTLLETFHVGKKQKTKRAIIGYKVRRNNNKHKLVYNRANSNLFLLVYQLNPNDIIRTYEHTIKTKTTTTHHVFVYKSTTYIKYNFLSSSRNEIEVNL